MSFERTSVSRGHRYRQFVENYWDPVKKQSRTRVLRHLGPVAEDERGNVATIMRIDGIQTACQAGHLALFYSTAKALSLTECLDTVCPSADGRDANALMTLVFNQLTGRRPLKEVGSWLDSTPLGRWMGVEGSAFTKDVLLSALDVVCTVENGLTTKSAFAIQKLATEAWREKVGKDPAHFYFYYDITRIRYNGSNCPWGERGYGPVATGRPHVGLGLVTSRGNHLPVLSLAVRGSVNDAITFKGMAEGLKVWNLGPVTVILDRGLFNDKNVTYARDEGFHVLGGCSETSDEVQAALRKGQDDQMECSTQVYLRPGNGELYYRGWEGRLFGEKGLLVLTLDPVRRTKERGARDRMLHELRAGASKARVRELRAALGNVVVSSAGRKGWRIDETAEAESRRVDGRFLLFTTDAHMEPDEVVRTYFQRDEVEKAFRDLNGGATLGPIRYRVPNHVEPYLTVICHLAYLIRAMVAWILKQEERPESIDQAIEILQQIHEVTTTFKGTQIPRWTRLTNQQQKLVGVFGLKDLVHSN